MASTRKQLASARRIVVKVGSQVVATSGPTAIAHSIANMIAQTGAEVVVVSSGAVAMGLDGCGFLSRPTDVHHLQAAASVGQTKLMGAWTGAFAPFGRDVGQVLLTHDDFNSRERFLNARATMRLLLERQVVPIVNENDTVSFDEIRFGDNDRLAASVAAMMDADALIILSSVAGLLDQKRQVVGEVTDIEAQARALVADEISALGTGGMASKLDAAQIATNAGVPTLLCSGQGSAMEVAMSGQIVGTYFPAAVATLNSRKHWLAYAAKSLGVIVVDDGAKRAIAESGRSLLPAGILGVRGDFSRGALVTVEDSQKHQFARGLTNYGNSEIKRIAGIQTTDILATLGYIYSSEVIHRDDLVLI